MGTTFQVAPISKSVAGRLTVSSDGAALCNEGVWRRFPKPRELKSY